MPPLQVFLRTAFPLLLSISQASTDRCLCLHPLAPGDGLPPSGEVSAGRHSQLAGHRQVQHHLPVLPGGFCSSCGHAEINRPAEISAPKVRAGTVTVGGFLKEEKYHPGLRIWCRWCFSLLSSFPSSPSTTTAASFFPPSFKKLNKVCLKNLLASCL